MAPKYKIWIDMEIVDDEKDMYISLQNPECLGAYNTEEEARRAFHQILISRLNQYAPN